MKILWTVNGLAPKVAKHFNLQSSHAISWVDAMSAALASRDDVDIAIASPANIRTLKEEYYNGITYYLLPLKGRKNDYWDIILGDFKPDIIHAYGTEHDHNITLIKRHPDCPIIGSLQGILSEYRHHYYAGIPHRTMIKYTMLQDFFLKTGFFSGKRDFEKRAKKEQWQLNHLQFVEGRSTWDRVSALNINPHLNYYSCPRMIRQPFFDYEWSPATVERHSVFVSQALTPIKGFHFVLMAIKKLRNEFPDVKLYVAGYDRLHPKKIRQKLTYNGYINYIKHLIKQLGIDDCVEFIGNLSDVGMAQRMAQSNVFVVSSSIENAPNSLAEAEVVGTPIVASYVGGNMDMLKHNEDGFLYCYNEPNMLAEYIKQIFISNELAQCFSNNAKKKARQRHDAQRLVELIMSIYSSVIKEYEQNKRTES